MASFLVEELSNAQITSATTTNLFTVTAGHAYIIKTAMVTMTDTNGGDSQKFYFELSDSAGANFTKITPAFTHPAAIGNYIVNLAPPNVDTQNPTSVVEYDATTTTPTTLLNATLASGQVLRMVSSGTFDGSDTMNVIINGIDHTE